MLITFIPKTPQIPWGKHSSCYNVHIYQHSQLTYNVTYIPHWQANKPLATQKFTEFSLRINIMRHSPFRGANSVLATYEIPFTLWQPEVQYGGPCPEPTKPHSH